MRVDGDLHKLSELGISKLNLNFKESNQVDQNGNELRQQSTFTRNGREQGLVDVWFRMNTLQA